MVGKKLMVAALWFGAVLGAGEAWAQTPAVSYGLPGEVLINSAFCFDATLTNTGDPGYGPYLRVVLEPGFTLDSAETLGGGTNQTVGTFGASGELTDPVSGDTVTGTEGGSFVVHQLPVGSVVTGGPPLVTEICLDNAAVLPAQADDTSADQSFLGVDAASVQPVYQFGDTATGDNGPLVGTAVADSLDLVEAIYTFEENASEDDNPPGASYPQTYTLNVDIADGRGLEPAYTYDIPDDEVFVDGTLDSSSSLANIAGCTVSVTPGGGAAGGTFSLDCSGSPVTGGSTTDDIVVSFDYYIRPSTLDTAQCPVGGNTRANAKHLTVEKGVSSPLIVPGDILTFTVGFEISVDATLTTLTLEDTLPDGLDFLENTVTLDFDQASGGLTSPADFTFNVSGGVTTINYDLRALNGRDFPSNTTGTLTYQAEVLESYAADGSTGNEPLLAADTLGGAGATATYSTAGGATDCTDGTDAQVQVRPVSGEKQLVAIEGAAPGNPVQVTPGDDVTYRIILNVPSGDTQDIVLEDFFPLPVFDVDTLNPATDISVVSGPTPSSVTTNSAQNSVRLLLPDVGSDPSSPQTLAYDLTLEVGDDPFADGLILSNLFQHGTKNTANTVADDVQVVAFTVRTPELTLDKKAVAAQGDANLSGENVTGADAADQLTYTLSVANTGGSEAYGVKLTDDAPAQGYGTCTVSTVEVDGADASGRFTGTVTGSSSDLFSSGLTLGTGEVIAAGETVVVTYTCTLPQSLRPDSNLGNTAAVTEYYGSAGAVGMNSKNYITKYGVLQDSTTLASRGASVNKTLQATSEGATSDPNVAVGEEITYQIVTTFPEGTVNNVVLSDSLQQDANGNLSIVSASITDIGDDLSWTGKPSSLPSSIPTTSTGFTLDLGTVTNAGSLDTSPDDEDRLTVEVVARVTNAAVNTRGKTPTNTGRLQYARGRGGTATKTSAVDVTVVEPTLIVTKTSSPDVADAGDTLTFTLNVEHAGASGATAFDLELTDIIPAGLSYAGSLQNTGDATVSGTLDDNSGAGPVTVTYDSLAQGAVGEVSFEVTVNASVSP